LQCHGILAWCRCGEIMTLLAHWKIGGAPGAYLNGQQATDAAGGGSGFHHGLYSLNVSSGGFLDPPGVDGLGMRNRAYSSYGTIYSIANNADFIALKGDMTVMAWYRTDNSTYNQDTMYIASCGGSGETSDLNHQWLLEVRTGNALRLFWEYGAGVDAAVQSANDILPVRTWYTHVAAVRYEIVPGFYGVRFYVNGVLVDTQTNGGAGYAAPTDGSNSPTYVGRSGDSQATQTFYIDSVRVYDTTEDAIIPGIYAAEAPFYALEAHDISPSFTRTTRGFVNYVSTFSGERNGRTGAGFSSI
jgi:hypothetical protein